MLHSFVIGMTLAVTPPSHLGQCVMMPKPRHTDTAGSISVAADSHNIPPTIRGPLPRSTTCKSPRHHPALAFTFSSFHKIRPGASHFSLWNYHSVGNRSWTRHRTRYPVRRRGAGPSHVAHHHHSRGGRHRLPGDYVRHQCRTAHLRKLCRASCWRLRYGGVHASK